MSPSPRPGTRDRTANRARERDAFDATPGFLYSRKLSQTGQSLTMSDHPSEAPLSGRDGGEWLVAAAVEGEEGIGPVRGVIVPGSVLPHAPALGQLLAVNPKPTQPEIASLLVELAASKGRLPNVGASRKLRPPPFPC